MSSAATAKRFGRPVLGISAASSGASWAPSRRAGRRRSAGMSSSAMIAARHASPTTPAATAIAPSARGWHARRQAELLPVPYFHVVFTLPMLAGEIAFQNKATVYAILFRAVAETLTTIAADRKHLGAQIGVTAVLHTWGQTLQHHPHIHCVVPGGGPSLDGTRWIACRPGFFLPVRVLSPLFRRLFLQNMLDAFDAGKLGFFGNLAGLAEPAAFATALDQLRCIEWVVYAKPPFGGPEQVLAYLGRYTHRVAIANSRLISLSDGKVRFAWKDYRQDSKTKVMTLDANEFIRRFLLHTLPDGFHRIRYYGLFANGQRGDNVALCRQLLDAHHATANSELADGHAKGARQNNACDFLICPDCGGTMRRIAGVPRSSTHQPFHCDTS